jgi:hypothetical protein
MMIVRGRPEGGAVDEDTGLVQDEITQLLDAVEELSARVRSLGDVAEGDDHAPAAVGLTGSSPGAQENRAIRGARAELARQQARAGRTELAELRRRTRALSEQARRIAEGAARGRHPQPVGGNGVGAEREGRHLAEVLDRAARDLLVRPAEEEKADEHALGLIVAGAMSAVPHVDRAGVLLLEGGGPVSRAPSDDVVAALDEVQATLREGPCHEAAHRAEHLVIEDVRTDRRWPRFAAAADEHGVRAVLAFQLFVDGGRPAGALNLYADTPNAFDTSSIDTGSLFASHASLVLYGARRTSGLATALRSRDLIGQAKGILEERFGLDERHAFEMLVSSSQQTNMKLRAVAEWLLDDAARRSGRIAGTTG